MSVFDVLKYGDTNLLDEKELKSLPQGLLHHYWVEANRWYTVEECQEEFNEAEVGKYPINNMVALLISWTPGRDIISKEVTRKRVFRTALIKYSNESL